VVESHGLPIGIVMDGANRHDIKLLEGTIQSVITAHSEGMNVCLNAGYVGSKKLVEKTGYKAHIRSRGEEREEKEHNRQYKARRWVVEVCHSWMNRFRKLLVRYEKKSPELSGVGRVRLCRYLIPVHSGLIPG
jgi:putative transposase